MIDFKNGTFRKLKRTMDGDFDAIIRPMLIPGEEEVASYRSIRDGVVFTNKRILSINIQGITGKKKDITSMPYSKIQVFSIETAGTLDLDSELEVWFSGVGLVSFEFSSNSNVHEIGQLISQYVL
ncbi:MAG: PH domain-containing protein [Erysipelotrichaceae bacterium]